jgi:hypothetical protein
MGEIRTMALSNRRFPVRCQYSNEPNSRGVSIVEVEDSTQSFTTFEGACIRRARYRCLNQLVTESLMVSFSVIVIDKLKNDLPKMLFAEGNDFVQTFLSGR